MSEWKPGDVAMVSIPGINDEPVRMIRTESGWDDGGTSYWDKGQGCWRIGDVRPLVVIDPEDAEQVERLREAWDNVEGVELDSEKPMSVRGYRMRAALREFARPTPPRPEEPTGRYAVVVDALGNEWIRLGDGPKAWMLNGSPGNRRDTYDYPGIGAVRVVSEGVQA